MNTWNDARNGALHFFGHTHEFWRDSANPVNVGLYVWDYGTAIYRETAQRATLQLQNRHRKDVELRV